MKEEVIEGSEQEGTGNRKDQKRRITKTMLWVERNVSFTREPEDRITVC